MKKTLYAVAGFSVMLVLSSIALNFLSGAIGMDPRNIGKGE